MPRPLTQLRRRALSLALSLSAAALALAAGERPAAACDAAYHYRVFPLGFAGDDRLVALTLTLHRFARGPRDPVVWAGAAALVEMTPFGEVTRTLHQEAVEVPDWPGRYVDGLRPVLAGALDRARELEGFVPLGRPQARFCDFARRCAHAKWTKTAEGRLAVDVRVNKARGHKLTALIPENVQRTLRDGATSWLSNYPRRLFMDAMAEHPYPFSSVRAYRGGGRTVFVIHAGSGQFYAEGDPDYDMVSERLKSLPKGACPALASCMYAEPTAHHGTGFDLVMTAGAEAPDTRIVAPIGDDFGWTPADLREREEEEARARELAWAARERREAERAAKVARATIDALT
ncbi:MAG: hypothetical protein KC486_33745, partial [Myxococcales bacterium]|nr:hypothetical protein [Myxococcales bacterium]